MRPAISKGSITEHGIYEGDYKQRVDYRAWYVRGRLYAKVHA